MAYVYLGKPTDKDAAEKWVAEQLGSHRNTFDLLTDSLNSTDYEVLCDMYELKAQPNQTMVVLCSNGKAVQLPFETQKDLLVEFRKIGWVPLEERIEIFLKQHPLNSEALALLFDTAINNLMEDARTLPQFIKTIQRINNTGSTDWMQTEYATITFGSISLNSDDDETRQSIMAIRQGISENRAYQQTINDMLTKIQDQIQRNPYSFRNYWKWAAFAALLPKPDPYNVLNQLDFIPLDMKVYADLSALASPLFVSADTINEGFKFLADLEEWMGERDSSIGTYNNFIGQIGYVANYKIKKLIKYKRYVELEKYLDELRPKLASEWSAFAKTLKDNFETQLKKEELERLPNITKVFEILNLPAIAQGEYFNEILLIHNFPNDFSNKVFRTLNLNQVNFHKTQDSGLAPNSWIVKNANRIVAGGTIGNTGEDANFESESKELVELIENEERKNFNKLKMFIFKNPTNTVAMDTYCERAAKYLPNEAIENTIYNYTSTTYTLTRGVIDVICDQMQNESSNESKWSAFIPKIISELLIKINDAPSNSDMNPWERLDEWEDFDIILRESLHFCNQSKYSIDWHSIVRDMPSWHNPNYYATYGIMPSSVFLKYIKQAEKSGDWKAVLGACEARFMFTKRQCKDEQILKMWTTAEEKLAR